jgi:hypothetical protein
VVRASALAEAMTAALRAQVYALDRPPGLQHLPNGAVLHQPGNDFTVLISRVENQIDYHTCNSLTRCRLPKPSI